MLLLFSATFLFSQRTITGVITDEDGLGLPGVSIIETGTTNGTITDLDGNYAVTVPQGATLTYSFVGYAAQVVEVGNQSVINLSLAPDAEILDEVVVTGYQTQRKRDITGAVSIVDDEALNVVPAASLSQKLAGKAAGLTLSTSGSPGDGTAIRIRGFNSLTANDPLFVIDGVPTTDNFLNSINPNDIESVQVLKDAASSSVYGARASNGVIVITTKKGKAGNTKVSYNGYYGIQNTVNRFELASADEYRGYVQEAYTDVPELFQGNTFPEFYNGDPALGFIAPTLGVPGSGNLLYRTATGEGTDWWDEVIGSAPITEHNINVSGGTDKGTFSISGNYYDQQGTVEETFFRRYTLRANSAFNAGKFTFGENIALSRIDQIGQPGGNQSEQNVITNIIRSNPTVPVFADDGVNFAGPKQLGQGLGNNPVKLVEEDRDDVGTFNRVFGNVYGGVELIDGLSFKTSLGFDIGNGFTQNATFPNFEAREPQNFTNNFSEAFNNSFQWTWTNTLNYVVSLGEQHDINAIAGYEALRNEGRNIGASLNDFFVFGVDSRFINTGLGNVDSRSVGSGGFESSLNSVFVKVDYVYDDWLILSGTVRNDGASNFGPLNRRGTFPAGSIGVRLTEFIDNESIDDLKVRYSFGISGNNNIPADNAFALFGGGTGSSFFDIAGTNNTLSTGFALQRRGNPAGRWEELEQHNFGIDATFNQGKYGIVLDIYNKNTNGLLFNAALPGTAGTAGTAFQNIASMRNSGFDAQLFYRDKITSDLSFDASLTLGAYRNEITQVNDESDQFFGNTGTRIGTITINRVGDPIGSFWGLTTDGIFESQAEVDAHAEQVGAAVGRLRYEDINNDGVINDDDNSIIGSFHPDLTAGLRLGLNYKGFDFSTFIFGSFGNDIYNFNRLFTDFSQFEANVSVERLENAFSSTNTEGTFPALDQAGLVNHSRSSDYFVEDGSYVRFETIQIGYTLSNLPSFDGNVRFYITAQNPFTFTGYSGLDPAISNFGRADTAAGVDFGNYPSNRSVLFGVNLNF
jgi:TonB-linked SusC/RagA family outer membrane protein